MNSETIAAVSGVTLSFPVGFVCRKTVLDRLDLSLEHGECLGIAGPSGAGKTTLLKVMLGLCHPTAGSVKLFGMEPRSALALHRIGYAPEDHGLPPGMTGREAQELHANMVGVSARNTLTLQLIEALDMTEALAEKIRTYSPGMRARLAFAIAMMGEPEFVVLDDPLAGLDPGMRTVIKEELRNFAERGGTAVITTHLLYELAGIVTRVILLNSARIVADDPAEVVYADVEKWHQQAMTRMTRDGVGNAACSVR